MCVLQQNVCFTSTITVKKKKRTPKETAELLDLPLGYIQAMADMLQKDAGASDLQIAERLMNIRI